MQIYSTLRLYSRIITKHIILVYVFDLHMHLGDIRISIQHQVFSMFLHVRLCEISIWR